MTHLATIAGIRRHLDGVRRGGKSIGLVPTMGALHAGHGALIDRARRETDHVIVSIFVNPIQFDRQADYEAYKVNLAADLRFCEVRGTDVVFAPGVEEMYPQPAATFVEVTGVSDQLCGKFRPGHFRGVATVVTKLLNIVAPDKAYFGEKDAQQFAVIQRMVADLNIAVEIVPVPTVRESDGLALSSRNQRLTAEERRVAPALYRALQAGQSATQNGASAGEIRDAALAVLREQQSIQVEYLEVVELSGVRRIAAAVWLGSTRLIDNVSAASPT